MSSRKRRNVPSPDQRNSSRGHDRVHGARTAQLARSLRSPTFERGMSMMTAPILRCVVHEASMHWREAAWAACMILFVAVNMHAAYSSVQSVLDEYRRDKLGSFAANATTMGRKRAARDVGIGLLPISHGKRRKLLSTDDALPSHLACPTQSRHAMRHLRAILTHPFVVACACKLRESLHNALEELFVSCLSFALCALLVLLLRTHSSLVVGVSVDLGAFSIDL